MRLQEYLALGGLLIVLLLASTVNADYTYNLQATLTDSFPVTIDQETHYYDLFFISSDGPAELTFNNYDANLITMPGEDYYNDPYLYLYTSFDPLNYDNFIYEDDDGNEDLGDGLYFYLDNVLMNNYLVAMITSYDPDTTGTVDFSIISDKQLSIQNIPEPMSVGLILLGGISLIVGRRLL
jgi:hypothetical protein|tara:strand:- start:700 stop:1242 length:543 start_codon:yes stop_codon:yes gene_type:complete